MRVPCNRPFVPNLFRIDLETKKGLTANRRKSFRHNQYRRRDLNPHGPKPHWILNPARLPIPPLRHFLHGNNLRYFLSASRALGCNGDLLDLRLLHAGWDSAYVNPIKCRRINERKSFQCRQYGQLSGENANFSVRICQVRRLTPSYGRLKDRCSRLDV